MSLSGCDRRIDILSLGGKRRVLTASRFNCMLISPAVAERLSAADGSDQTSTPAVTSRLANEVAELQQQLQNVVNDFDVLRRIRASMSRCRETLRPCRRPNRMLAKRFLRSFRPRSRTARREKRSQGLSTRKPQGNQLQHPSRRRLRLPERHRQPSNRLVHLCQCQPLLKHRRPSIDLCRHWPLFVC